MIYLAEKQWYLVGTSGKHFQLSKSNGNITTAECVFQLVQHRQSGQLTWCENVQEQLELPPLKGLIQSPLEPP